MAEKHMALRKRLKRGAARRLGVSVRQLEWRNGILHRMPGRYRLFDGVMFIIEPIPVQFVRAVPKPARPRVEAPVVRVSTGAPARYRLSW